MSWDYLSILSLMLSFKLSFLFNPDFEAEAMLVIWAGAGSGYASAVEGGSL